MKKINAKVKHKTLDRVFDVIGFDERLVHVDAPFLNGGVDPKFCESCKDRVYTDTQCHAPYFKWDDVEVVG